MATIKPGTVTKSPEGWARFRDKTASGATKRPAVAVRSHFLPTRKGR